MLDTQHFLCKLKLFTIQTIFRHATLNAALYVLNAAFIGILHAAEKSAALMAAHCALHVACL